MDKIITVNLWAGDGAVGSMNASSAECNVSMRIKSSAVSNGFLLFLPPPGSLRSGEKTTTHDSTRYDYGVIIMRTRRPWVIVQNETIKPSHKFPLPRRSFELEGIKSFLELKVSAYFFILL